MFAGLADILSDAANGAAARSEEARQSGGEDENCDAVICFHGLWFVGFFWVILDGVFHGCSGFAGAFLDAAEEFLLFALHELMVVIGELRPLLFEVALDDVPLTLGLWFFHRS